MRISPYLLVSLVILLFCGLALLTLTKSPSVEANRAAGETFLANNAKQEGVKTTASGLQYQILTEGAGEHPVATDKVTVHYQGSTLAGAIFDSSYNRGHPLTFSLANVIPGWTEGLQLMRTGAKYRLFIPSELAYGSQGAGADIEPDATLIFDVELIRIH
ncbi:MAG TPA: FKBP-type peptidyl-prolyl cis-trans isomerase [Methylococcaceae bacterium]|nr:FKBP-type peptidyl-prolyl cis-trans isomerase [Methylococcaceae bacterium]HIN67786.1 FKBP-type peptidyl-prolyl cis-trans isomerase [Methylococcales bacterium]HIA45589.1 FKBP-type peptidyl-prolyl cis-trans isomerase [Methylococcaceae bacterium]HIB61688.1 FKBP-type peptidyl-prolyl cis-trans isomerase [Methylococcaceae bacterium]HIO12163.1 FKBP-type peptidyl-prolyl cis-trans isomerase [Methylococcales bacterium]